MSRAETETALVDPRTDVVARLEELAAGGRHEEAEDALYDLIDADVELGTRHCNLVISSCIPHGDIERAERWLFRMQALQVNPDLDTYNTLIRVAVKAKDTQSAGRWFEEMQGMGVPPDLATFQLMLQVASAAQDLGTIEVWFEKLMNLGLQPDSACCAEAIRAFAGKRDVEKVQEWLGISEQSFGIKPDRDMLTSAMRAYADSDDLERAEAVMQRMLDDGMQLTAESYIVLVGNGEDGTRPDSMVKEWSKKLKEAGVELRVSDYEAVIGAWATLGDADAVQDWFGDMVAEGKQTPTALATVVEAILIDGTRQEGASMAEASETAQEWVDQLRNAGMELTPAVFGALASADIMSGEFEQVEARLQQMEVEGIEMDEHGLIALLLAYANAEPQQTDLAAQVFKQHMLAGRMLATREVLEALRAAVGGARCLALRRELQLTKHVVREPDEIHRLSHPLKDKPKEKPRRQWNVFKNKVEMPEWVWE